MAFFALIALCFLLVSARFSEPLASFFTGWQPADAPAPRRASNRKWFDWYYSR